MSNPKISVIIPIYNVEKYLEKCLESVRQQTFSDIEIICVDDCSPDNSADIVEKHMSEDSRILFIRHEKNTGLGGARNSAIRVAKGEYIASVDSDDYMNPNMLEKLWNATDNGLHDIVSCGFNRVDELGNILSYTKYEDKSIKENEINIFKTLSPAFWNKLWRKSLFTDNQIYFPNHDYYEDMSTTPRILSKVKSIILIKDRLYNYLSRPESITGSYGDKQIIDYFKGFEILLNYLHDSKIYDDHENDYKEYVKNNVAYHAKGVLSANLFIEQKKQYLRNLLFLRMGFQENYERIKNNDIDDLILLFKEDNPSFLSKALDKAHKNLEDKNNLITKYDNNANNYKKDILILKERSSSLQTTVSEQILEKTELVKESLELERINKNLRDSIFSLETKIQEQLSFSQHFWVNLFSIFARFTLSDRQRLKLKNKPKQFFKDSKNGYVKWYSEFFKIID